MKFSSAPGHKLDEAVVVQRMEAACIMFEYSLVKGNADRATWLKPCTPKVLRDIFKFQTLNDVHHHIELTLLCLLVVITDVRDMSLKPPVPSDEHLSQQ